MSLCLLKYSKGCSIYEVHFMETNVLKEKAGVKNVVLITIVFSQPQL